VNRALASIFESSSRFGGMMAIYWIFGGLALAVGGLSAAEATARAPGRMLPMIVLSSLAGPAFMFAIPVAVTLATLVGRSRYRATIRPAQQARAPEAPGAPSRCRVCCADLPDVNEAMRTCRYCSTVSVATLEIAARVENRAMAVAEFQRRQGMHTSAVTTTVAKVMTRVLVVSLLVFYALVLVAIKLSQGMW
jgi:hypothetical protein